MNDKAVTGKECSIVVSPGPGAAARPDAEQEHGVHRCRARRWDIRGLLPPHVGSQKEQIARVLENFR